MGKRLKGPLATAMFDHIQNTAAGERFHEMLKQGLVPSGSAKGSFYQALLRYADFKKDVGLFEKALEGVNEVYGDVPRAARFLKNQADKLAKMKAGSK